MKLIVLIIDYMDYWTHIFLGQQGQDQLSPLGRNRINNHLINRLWLSI